MRRFIEDHQFVAVEAAKPLVLAAEMSKPIAILYLLRMSLVSFARHIPFFFMIDAVPFVLFSISIIVWGIGHFISYGLTQENFVVVSSIGQIFGRRQKVVVAEILIADFKIASVTDYGFGNGTVAFRSNNGRPSSLCQWRTGVWWFFLSVPIRFGFYGISTNGPVTRHLRGG